MIRRLARSAYLVAGALVAAGHGLRLVVARGEDRRRCRERLGLWEAPWTGTGPAAFPARSSGRRTGTGGAGEEASSRGKGESVGGDWVWIHAASLGEARIATALARALAPRLASPPSHIAPSEAGPDTGCGPGPIPPSGSSAATRLVVTSTTATGIGEASREGSVETHWFPIDFPPVLNRILRSGPPRLFVAIETEVWPELLTRLASRGVPTAIVSARLSDRSLPRYRRLAWYLAPALRSLGLVAARDDEAARRWASIGVPAEVLTVTGDIKFDLGSGGQASGKALEPLLEDAAASGPTSLLVAASTHEGEDEVVLDAFVRVRGQWAAAWQSPALAGRSSTGPPARLVLAPRHPQRADAVAALVLARGLSLRRWSETEHASATEGASALAMVPVNEERSALAGESGNAPAGESGRSSECAPRLAGDFGADVLLLDVVGVLGRAYASADAAFVGGSLRPGPGGHNLIEAVEAGCPVAAGPHLENVTGQAGPLAETGALRVVHDAESLSKFWLEVLENKEKFRDPLARAVAALAARRGALSRTVDALLALLDAKGAGR